MVSWWLQLGPDLPAVGNGGGRKHPYLLFWRPLLIFKEREFSLAYLYSCKDSVFIKIHISKDREIQSCVTIHI